MYKLVTVVISTAMFGAAASAGAAEPAKGSETARESSKADWVAECVASARQRDATLTESAARSTCKNTTGSGSATRATLPGHSGNPAPGSKEPKSKPDAERTPPR